MGTAARPPSGCRWRPMVGSPVRASDSIHRVAPSVRPLRATVATSGGTYRQRSASPGRTPRCRMRVSEPSEPAAQIATATAPSGPSACWSSESATAWVSCAAASAPLSAARNRTAADCSAGSSGFPTAARNACVTSDTRSLAAWLMTSTANSSGLRPDCPASTDSCCAASLGPQPRRSTRMPLASSTRARPSASAWASRTSRRSRSTVAAVSPRVRAWRRPPAPAGSRPPPVRAALRPVRAGPGPRRVRWAVRECSRCADSSAGTPGGSGGANVLRRSASVGRRT